MSRAQRGTVVTEVSQADDGAAYQRLYRERRQGAVQRNRDLNCARMAALRRLARRYPAEYRRALLYECRIQGIDPPDPRYGRI